MSQPGSPLGASLVGPTARALARLISAPIPLLKQPDQHIFADAAGSWGCGAWSAPHWFQVQWNSEWGLQTIALKELLPVVIAVALWGNIYRGWVILCHCTMQLWSRRLIACMLETHKQAICCDVWHTCRHCMTAVLGRFT